MRSLYICNLPFARLHLRSVLVCPFLSPLHVSQAAHIYRSFPILPDQHGLYKEIRLLGHDQNERERGGIYESRAQVFNTYRQKAYLRFFFFISFKPHSSSGASQSISLHGSDPLKIYVNTMPLSFITGSCQSPRVSLCF